MRSDSVRECRVAAARRHCLVQRRAATVAVVGTPDRRLLALSLAWGLRFESADGSRSRTDATSASHGGPLPPREHRKTMRTHNDEPENSFGPDLPAPAAVTDDGFAQRQLAQYRVGVRDGLVSAAQYQAAVARYEGGDR
ncbi:hypothetical protein EGH24_13920 [Halonotius terrestris]|uniref:Uncharacterized protein n=1 Tax=Halonotius terrestris TaxID=2487750 RepID=A0A8J8PAP0_9EURY|nr:hypothetical protein [Halonotius terrestris]TQQ78615.1 hypothetical protein EGH24_13920 [Halonotius terrestris]